MIEGLEEEIVKKIKEAKDKDEEVIKVVEEMKKAGVKVLRNEEWQIEEGLVLKCHMQVPPIQKTTSPR